MSSNFYDYGGWMIGIDGHTYLAALGSPLIPAPTPNSPYAVWALFDWIETNKKACKKVTSDGERMVNGSHEIYVVPHVPIPVSAPSVWEIPNTLAIIAGSSSKPGLAVSSVTGEGDPLAACVFGAFGINMNCGTWKVALAINLNTVKTVPSVGDYLRMVANIGTEMLIDFGVGKFSNPVIKWIVKELLDRLKRQLFKAIS